MYLPCEKIHALIIMQIRTAGILECGFENQTSERLKQILIVLCIKQWDAIAWSF